jgi:hypothetical protein
MAWSRRLSHSASIFPGVANSLRPCNVSSSQAFFWVIIVLTLEQYVQFCGAGAQSTLLSAFCQGWSRLPACTVVIGLQAMFCSLQDRLSSVQWLEVRSVSLATAAFLGRRSTTLSHH